MEPWEWHRRNQFKERSFTAQSGQGHPPAGRDEGKRIGLPIDVWLALLLTMVVWPASQDREILISFVGQRERGQKHERKG